MTAVRATKAKFPPDAQRRAMMAKIHLAEKTLRLSPDEFEAIKLKRGGASSCADMDNAALSSVLARLVELGFQPMPRSNKGKSRPADHAVARKARALWISLWNLGVTPSVSEAALENFAKRQMGCEKLQWADLSQGYKLIEALKKRAEEAGWSQDVGTSSGPHAARKLAVSLVHRQKEILVERGQADASWMIYDLAYRLEGLDFGDSWTLENFHQLARHLGERIRAGHTGTNAPVVNIRGD